MPSRGGERSETRQWAAAAIGQRLVLAVVGGYFLSAAAASFIALALSTVIPRSEAVLLMAMCVFVIYLAILLWAFTEHRLLVLWVVLGGGSTATQLVLLWAGRVLSGA